MRNNRYKGRKANRRKKSIFSQAQIQKIIKISAILFIVIVFSIVFALMNSVNNEIITRMKIEGIDVSNLEIKEAYEKINNEIKERISKNINIKYKDYETTISLEQIEAMINTQEEVNYAYKIGRDKNIIKSNYQILFTMLFGRNIEGSISVNEQELNNVIDDISVKIPGIKIDPSYYIEDDNLIISRGQKGIEIQKEKLKKDILKSIEKQIHKNEEQTIELQVAELEPANIDIDKIYKEVYKKPENAYYEIETSKVFSEVNGIDFAISVEDAKAMLQEQKEEYIIPLKVTVPEVTIQALGNKVFADELGKYSTRYSITNENRNTNIELASKKIDGYILKPGEVFSYNQIVGERTIAAGYKEAAVYINGEVADGIGGGICQVSSTLYNAALYANLEIVSRKNHYFLTSYVGASRDATVSYGSIDFKFKNNRNYPIKISCTAKNGISEVKILGTKEETEYEVVIQNEVTQVIPYTTKYVETTELATGEENIVRQGTNGYKSEAYKVLKLDGKVISKTLLSKDSYNPMQEIIEKGK